MAGKLIFVPYQDTDDFYSSGILTREYAMLYMLKRGFEHVIAIKKPRTFLDKKRYMIDESFYPQGTVEKQVRDILKGAETAQYTPFVSAHQILKKRGWWEKGYKYTERKINMSDIDDTCLVYSNNPFAVDLLYDMKKRKARIYFDIMDNFAIHPSLNTGEKKAALSCYKKIFNFADVISANSGQTCEFMQRFSEKKIYLVKNGVFKNNSISEVPHIRQIAEIKNKKEQFDSCVGYVGKLGMRIDEDLIDKISKQAPGVLFVFVGECLKGQNNRHLMKLFEKRENLLHIEAVPSAYVYAILDLFDILAIPHSVGKNENGGDPLKLYQYMTRRKPVIVTPILGVTEFKDSIAIRSTVDEWLAFIHDPMPGKCPDIDKFTWENRLEPVVKVMKEWKQFHL